MWVLIICCDLGCTSTKFEDLEGVLQILDAERIPQFVNHMVLEGGSIHVDGEGK